MTLRNELSGGTPVVRGFEKTWREWVGSRYCITVSNGSMALYSAFFGVGLGPGDEFIAPTYTWICSVSGAIMLGARPVFAESDPDTLMIDPEDVRRRITDRTRAIVAVHLWGNVCDMDAFAEISRETGVPVIEDCSHAHGARFGDRPVGTVGAAGCWSLQGSKPLSAGEGGVLVTDDIDLFERACVLGQVNRIKGLDLATTKFEHLQPFGIGMKTRAHPLGIGIAAEQWKKLPDLNARRRAYIEQVEAAMADLPGLCPVKAYEKAERAGFYGFPVHHVPAESGMSTARFVRRLNDLGLPAGRNAYTPLHSLSIFKDGFDLFTRGRCGLSDDYPGYGEEDFPVTRKALEDVVFLPLLSDPIPGATNKVIEALRRAVG